MSNTKNCFNNPCYCINVKRAAGNLTSYYDKALEKCNLSVGQFSLLWNLATIGESNVTKLAECLGLERSTVVRNLRPLLFDGFISDNAQGGSRDRQLFVTEKGKEALTIGIPLWKQAQKDIRKIVGSDDLGMFKDVISKLQKI